MSKRLFSSLFFGIGIFFVEGGGLFEHANHRHRQPERRRWQNNNLCELGNRSGTGRKESACPVCATDKSKCTGKAPEPPAETPEPEKETPAGLNPAALILLLALLGGGGVFAYLKLVKNKPKTKGNDSLDDYDYGEEDSEEWETENEESDEPDADGGSTEEDDEDSVK